jgi:hypothetical protein
MAIREFPTYATQLVQDLAEEFPPRCMKADETVEAHLLYAGKAWLVAELQLRIQAAEKIKE